MNNAVLFINESSTTKSLKVLKPIFNASFLISTKIIPELGVSIIESLIWEIRSLIDEIDLLWNN